MVNSKLNCDGPMDPSCWTRRMPPKPTMAPLTTKAINRGVNTSMPMAPAANSSSRVATASRPVLLDLKKTATTTATVAPTNAHVLPSKRGTPLRFCAPPVRSLRFSATCRTMNRNASVIMVAARPEVRAATKPSNTDTAMAAPRPMSVATNGLSSMSGMPHGAFGISTPLRAAGTASSAMVYAPTLAMPKWPNDSTPVLPMNTWKPMTMIMLMSRSVINRSRAELPPDA